MAAASSPLSLSPPSLSCILKPKPLSYLNKRSPLPPLSPIQPSSRRSYHLPKPTRISAINDQFWISEASPVENSQEIVTTNGDGISIIISALLGIAFICLSVLTIGVIYIGVTDFLTKREREKFEKEEAGKKKKSGKKGRAVTARARAGPRGFGQKIEEDDDDVDKQD